MAKLTPEQWAQVKQAIADSYIRTKEEIRAQKSITVVSEREIDPNQKLLSANMEGTVVFDSSRLNKEYELTDADWSFALAQNVLGLGASIRIQGPGHHETKVTEEFMSQVNELFANACTNGGFNKIVTHRYEHGVLNEKFYVWSMAYCILFND